MATDPLSVHCPHCGARAGQRCMMVNGPTPRPHAARIKAAKALDAYQEASNEIAELTGR